MPVNVIRNHDFSEGSTTYTGFVTPNEWEINTSTSASTKGYQGWRFTGGAMCLTADTYGTTSTDPTYLQLSVLSQKGCFTHGKKYMVRVFFDHDHVLKTDDATYNQYGMGHPTPTPNIYFHHNAGVNDNSNNQGVVYPESYAYVRYGYSNTSNQGSRYPINQFMMSGATDLAIYAAYARRERLTKVEAYEISETGGTNSNHTLQIKYGDSAAACDAATYKTFLYNTWLSQDGSGYANGNTAFEPGYKETKITARYVKLRVWFNNDFKEM